MYIYIYTRTVLPVNAIVRLLDTQSWDSQGSNQHLSLSTLKSKGLSCSNCIYRERLELPSNRNNLDLSWLKLVLKFIIYLNKINPFQPNFVLHIETSYFICNANPMACFYMKCNTRLKWVTWKNQSKDLFHSLKKLNLMISFTK